MHLRTFYWVVSGWYGSIEYGSVLPVSVDRQGVSGIGNVIASWTEWRLTLQINRKINRNIYRTSHTQHNHYCEAQGKGRTRGRPRKVTQRSFIDGGWWMVDILSLMLYTKFGCHHHHHHHPPPPTHQKFNLT